MTIKAFLFYSILYIAWPVVTSGPGDKNISTAMY